MSESAGRGPGPRYFSLAEANRTLPLVRRIVADIVERYGELEPMVARFRRLPEERRSTPDGRRLKDQIDTTAERLDALIQELHALGCRFKGFREGLVDWYSYYAGRTVLLCWRLGEPEIGHWHQIDAGYVGRQEILPGQADAFRATPA